MSVARYTIPYTYYMCKVLFAIFYILVFKPKIKLSRDIICVQIFFARLCFLQYSLGQAKKNIKLF